MNGSIIVLSKIIKSKKLKCWMANIWLVEDLFHYKYPFLLPDLFRRKISKDEFDVAFEVIIPYLKVKKNGRLWTVNVAIAKQLYEYKYPFQINEYFLTWETTYQFQVKSQIITLTAIDFLKKEFYIQEFLKGFSVSNKKKTQ